jgi:hypothetical protein
VASKPVQKAEAPAKQVAAPQAAVKPQITPEAIAQRAFEIWQREGCPEGCEADHWFRAEQELRK